MDTEKDIYDMIDEISKDELAAVLDHVLFHYGQLFPQWSVSVLSVDKRENVIDQINETIALLETLKKNPQLVIPGVIKA